MAKRTTPTPVSHLAYHAYCDESGLHGSRYRVYGGVVLLEESVRSIERMVATWRARTHIQSELAWNSISDGVYREYRAFVDRVFEVTRNVEMAYKAMVIDTHNPDFVEFNKKNSDLAFYKLYYQFLLHKFAEYGACTPNRSLRIWIDDRETKFDLKDLHGRLNSGIIRKFGQRNVVKSVEHVLSHESPCVQIVDVLTGAIAYDWNAMNSRTDAMKSKVELVTFISRKARVDSLHERTRWSRQDFEIWPWVFHKSRAVAPGARPRMAPGRPGLLPLQRPPRRRN